MATPHPRQGLLFAFLMSLYMACIMSGILTLINTGFDQGYWYRWLHAFLIAWACAFPLVLLGAPVVRKLVERLLRPRSAQ